MRYVLVRGGARVRMEYAAPRAQGTSGGGGGWSKLVRRCAAGVRGKAEGGGVKRGG